VYLSEKIVMQVTCEGEGGTLAGTLAYFRGKAMESYGQSSWQHTPWEPGPAALRLSGPRAALAAGAMELTVTMDPDLLPELFAPYPTLAWDARGGDLQIDGDMTVRLLRFTRTDRPYRYHVYVLPESLAATRQAALSVRFAPDMAYPPSSSVEATPRVVDLARRWCSDLLAERPADPGLRGASDLAIAQRIAERLRENYAYSLDLSSADSSRDAVEDFLFHMKQGHCEYFASALTVMCCALDVPARLVTGFRVEETDGSPGRYIVRERDAHAWTEVYVPLTGWVTVDATPAAPEGVVRRHWWRWVDTFLSRLTFHWYNLVVGYDASAQGWLGQQLAGAVQQGYLALATLTGDMQKSFENLLVYGYIDQAMIRLSIALAAVAVVLEVLLGVRIHRRRARRRRAARVLAAQPWGALVFIPALLDRLERQDPHASIDRTVMETARAAQRRRALPPGELEDLVSIYYRARWGGRRPSESEVAAARRRTEALGERLAASSRGRSRGIRR
jgi:transglutaminase-like putative cysteine protease